MWSDSVSMVTEVYLLTNDFPSNEKFGLVSQINRSAVSIPSNIAEGAGRLSKKEFVQFLGYAIASSFELETQIIIACNLKIISIKQRDEIVETLNIIQRKTHSLINSIRKQY